MTLTVTMNGGKNSYLPQLMHKKESRTIMKTNNCLSSKKAREFSGNLKDLGVKPPFTFDLGKMSFKQNGSMANVSAILELCEGNCERCLVACGSYVVGGDIANMLE